jgi:hypothetical protein
MLQSSPTKMVRARHRGRAKAVKSSSRPRRACVSDALPREDDGVKQLLKAMLGQPGGRTVTAPPLDGSPPAMQGERSGAMADLLATVRRLDADASPFGVPVIDCREFATGLLDGRAEPVPPHTTLLPREYRIGFPGGADPLACNLRYPLTAALPEGPLMLGRTVVDRWHVFHYGGRLIFTRSGIGDPVFAAELAGGDGEVRVPRIMAASGMTESGPELAVAMVDFLVKSHLFRVAAPHPLPADLPDDPALAATWSFSQFGRWGHYGARVDTTRLRLVGSRRGLALMWTT